MLYYILSICLVVIDQVVKWWVRANIPLGEAIPFVPGMMDLAYVQNTGAAFSSFSGMTWVLTLVSLGASVAVAALLRRDFFPGKWGRLCLSLILAGAVGNLIDRAAFGKVTDMFNFTFMTFGVFNVADICVVGGVIGYAGYALLAQTKKDADGGDGDSHEADPERPL